MLKLLVATLSALLLATPAMGGEADRPNIIWITIDDVGPDFACYGNGLVKTPSLDALAERGQRFERCFVTTPVCSAVRSALITGSYATTIGAHQHRSKRPLPEGYAPITEHLGRAGYRCTALPVRRVKHGRFLEERTAGTSPEKILSITGRLKLDFNFNRGQDADMFTAWDPEAEGPFFAMIDFNPQKGPARWAREVAAGLDAKVNPDDVTIHPYWPDTPEMRDRVALYNEAVSVLDAEIGEVFAWLDRQDLADDTVVFVWGDHGQAAFRHKQWCYDSGLRVPLIVAGPGVTPARRSELVSSIDLAATTLRLAGVVAPVWMEGRDFLGAGAEARTHIFASRDRCDESEDRVRAVRSERFKLIHNFHPELPYIDQNDYTRRAFLEVPQLLAMRATGELSDTQALWCGPTKAEWEFFDLETDPLELQNIYGDSAHADDIEALRKSLEVWVARTDANNPFPEEMATIIPNKAHRQVSEARAAERD